MTSELHIILKTVYLSYCRNKTDVRVKPEHDKMSLPGLTRQFFIFLSLNLFVEGADFCFYVGSVPDVFESSFCFTPEFAHGRD